MLIPEEMVCDLRRVSNVALGVVPLLASHPLPALVAAGVAFTLTADDALWFGSGTPDHHELAGSAFGFQRRAAGRDRLDGRPGNGPRAGSGRLAE